MGTVSRGFKGRRERPSVELPPGQYLVEDFPVLSAGPTPDIDLADWELTITSETGDQQRWDWDGFRSLPSETVTVDLHCVTHWSKLHTTWEGVSLDTLLDGVETSASFALVSSYGGYSTNLPLEDLTDHKAWIAFGYDGQELEPEHGGPARLLVPTCICGRAPSGSMGSSCWTRTSPASGKASATTTTATPGDHGRPQRSKVCRHADLGHSSPFPHPSNHQPIRINDLETEQTTLLEQILASPQITVTDLKFAGVLPVPEGMRKLPRMYGNDALFDN